jgi:hypothetical protein
VDQRADHHDDQNHEDRELINAQVDIRRERPNVDPVEQVNDGRALPGGVREQI